MGIRLLLEEFGLWQFRWQVRGVFRVLGDMLVCGMLLVCCFVELLTHSKLGALSSGAFFGWFICCRVCFCVEMSYS